MPEETTETPETTTAEAATAAPSVPEATAPEADASGEGAVPAFDAKAANEDLIAWSIKHNATLVAFNPETVDVHGNKVVLRAQIRIEENK